MLKLFFIGIFTSNFIINNLIIFSQSIVNVSLLASKFIFYSFAVPNTERTFFCYRSQIGDSPTRNPITLYVSTTVGILHLWHWDIAKKEYNLVLIVMNTWKLTTANVRYVHRLIPAAKVWDTDRTDPIRICLDLLASILKNKTTAFVFQSQNYNYYSVLWK